MARRVGRPFILNDTIQAAYFENLEIGMGFEEAAALAGVTYRSVCNWREAGRTIQEKIDALPEGEKLHLTADEDRLLQFFLAEPAAIAQSQKFHLVNLENHSQQDPNISKWILERRFPKTFGPSPNRVEHSGPDGRPIESKDVSDMPVEERAARIAYLLQRAAERAAAQEPGEPAPDDDPGPTP